MALPTQELDRDDLELARRIDIDALYDRYRQRTFAFLASLGVRGADAEDVHQKVWIKVFQTLRERPFEGHFRGWLFQVLRNAAIDLMRRKRPESIEETGADSVVAATASPDASLIEAEQQAALTRCVEQLESQQRAIVVGRLSGETYSQISGRLNIESSRAHRIFFDAKQTLSDCVRQSLGGDQS